MDDWAWADPTELRIRLERSEPACNRGEPEYALYERKRIVAGFEGWPCEDFVVVNAS